MEPDNHSLKQVLSIKIILPTLQMRKMKLRDVKYPRSHSWSVVETNHELLTLLLKYHSLSTFAAINILQGILQFSRHF